MGKYTHIDTNGMAWRFEGSRPVSALADKVMKEVFQKDTKNKKKRK